MERAHDIEIVVNSPRIEVGNKMRRLTPEEMRAYLARKTNVSGSSGESPTHENGGLGGLAVAPNSEQPT